jgi:hypothetical protein
MSSSRDSKKIVYFGYHKIHRYIFIKHVSGKNQQINDLKNLFKLGIKDDVIISIFISKNDIKKNLFKDQDKIDLKEIMWNYKIV